MTNFNSTAALLARDSAAYETSPITPEIHEFRENIDRSVHVQLNDKRLAKITRFRVFLPSQEERMSGYTDLDVSYVYGVMKDGSKVAVNVPLRLDGRLGVKGAIVKMCRDLGVYGKSLGLFDYDVISTLRS